MTVLSDLEAMRLLDGIACALLAAAATVRARAFGAHVTGAVVLGCLCGLLGPLLRETFLHGGEASAAAASQFPAEALAGALGGLAACAALKGRLAGLFFWTDSASLGLATCMGGLLALPDNGIVGALSIGLINGLAPGLVRDMALGDTAMLVDREWYATAAVLGCLAAIGMLVWLAVGWISEWTAMHADVSSVLAGTSVALVLRAWKGRKADI